MRKSTEEAEAERKRRKTNHYLSQQVAEQEEWKKEMLTERVQALLMAQKSDNCPRISSKCEKRKSKLLNWLSQDDKKQLAVMEAQAFKDKEKTNRIRHILEKAPEERKQHESQELLNIVMKNKFFVDRPNIKQEELRELVSCITLDQRQQFEDVFRYQDEGEHFYIILEGIVRVKIPNPTIKNWKLER